MIPSFKRETKVFFINPRWKWEKKFPSLPLHCVKIQDLRRNKVLRKINDSAGKD